MKIDWLTFQVGSKVLLVPRCWIHTGWSCNVGQSLPQNRGVYESAQQTLTKPNYS